MKLEVDHYFSIFRGVNWRFNNQFRLKSPYLIFLMSIDQILMYKCNKILLLIQKLNYH